MTPETLEYSKIDRLDLEHRAPLHIEVMKLMLGENPTAEDELVWTTDYGKKISDLIDYHEHDEIRQLAMTGNYDQAAKLLKDLLEE